MCTNGLLLLILHRLIPSLRLFQHEFCGHWNRRVKIALSPTPTKVRDATGADSRTFSCPMAVREVYPHSALTVEHFDMVEAC